MSDELNRDLLIALKALLYIKDNPNGAYLTYGLIDPVIDFARNTIERAEMRPHEKTYKINGVPEGWYDDIKSGKSPNPLALLQAAYLEKGNPDVFRDYGIKTADLDAYLNTTAISATPENTPQL